MPDYPGLGLPLRHLEQSDYGFYPIGAHGSCYGSDSELLAVRELAMMMVMDRLTDKPDWHKKVFDDTIVAKWREEALAIPDEELWKLSVSGKGQHFDEGGVTLRDDWWAERKGKPPIENIMDENAFEFCVKELQVKAKYFEKSGIVPTLDACASVAKSDNLVEPGLHEALRKAFEKLKADQAAHPDWHPGTKEMVQDLVHPSMYPMVYGRSRVLQEEVVGVADAIEKWAGKGNIVPKDTWTPSNEDRYRYGVGSGDVPPQFWSDTYQWLPANVAFQDDGSVKFTSYINNLHPNKYPEIYRTIERLIQTSLPMWDQCLALAKDYKEREGAGRLVPRIPVPDDCDDELGSNWQPSDPQEVADVKVNWEEQDDYAFDPEYDDETECKWKLLRKPVQPGAAWIEEDEKIEYTPNESIRLAKKFKESGLQVVVKMASIELTPEKPEFPAGGWHVEGQMNEHIAATALYYLDSDNITPSSLHFRMQTSAYMNDDISVGQDAYHWLEKCFGTGLGGGGSPCLQNYGSVETREGRLLAFPNVLQHRVSPFELKDETKPGHRRFIALWLVDPHKRVISTANVPPQQQDWWLESVFGSTDKSRDSALTKLPAELVALLQEKGLSANISGSEGTLPPELMEMVREHFNADKDTLPMTLEEAREHRKKLMEERSAFVRKAEEGWQEHTYSFCEH